MSLWEGWNRWRTVLVVAALLVPGTVVNHLFPRTCGVEQTFLSLLSGRVSKDVRGLLLTARSHKREETAFSRVFDSYFGDNSDLLRGYTSSGTVVLEVRPVGLLRLIGHPRGQPSPRHADALDAANALARAVKEAMEDRRLERAEREKILAEAMLALRLGQAEELRKLQARVQEMSEEKE